MTLALANIMVSQKSLGPAPANSFKKILGLKPSSLGRNEKDCD